MAEFAAILRQIPQACEKAGRLSNKSHKFVRSGLFFTFFLDFFGFVVKKFCDYGLAQEGVIMSKTVKIYPRTVPEIKIICHKLKKYKKRGKFIIFPLKPDM
ncbi:MAG: hypothetical protein LBK13_00235 [Spirochaetales bacterium]|jgi:hypothetical protein|nr:hypothetical protein [Spirochaetales bacterium]